MHLESILLKEDDIAEHIEYVKKNYDEVNTSNLVCQLDVFNLLMKGCPRKCFKDVLGRIQELSFGEKDLISEIVTICVLINVNPATSATGERTFSMARRVKTWLRSTMTQKLFNSIALLHFHKERTDKLCLTDVANEFVECNKNLRRNFGAFRAEV